MACLAQFWAPPPTSAEFSNQEKKIPSLGARTGKVLTGQLNKGGWHLGFKVWGLGQPRRQPLEAMMVVLTVILAR